MILGLALASASTLSPELREAARLPLVELPASCEARLRRCVGDEVLVVAELAEGASPALPGTEQVRARGLVQLSVPDDAGPGPGASGRGGARRLWLRWRWPGLVAAGAGGAGRTPEAQHRSRVKRSRVSPYFEIDSMVIVQSSTSPSRKWCSSMPTARRSSSPRS